VGCVTALAFARKGARVLLLEGNPRSAQRLAGESLHPSGVQVLEDIGLGSLVRSGFRGRGFAVFPGDSEGPIFLHYPDGCDGLTCDHYSLVSSLRQSAASDENIEFVSSGQATRIDGQELHYYSEDGRSRCVRAGLIVGADGRSSLARKCLGLADRRSFVSSMAGVLLEDVDPLHDGFGLVLLGGPGPVLAVRIGPGSIRLFLDLPVGRARARKDADYLRSAFQGVLPAPWQAPFARALAERGAVWASNQWRSRMHYGRPGLALVGDAVGHFHPLTAVGLTLGFLDAAGLAECKSFSDYRRRRARQSGVAQMLAFSLYQVFTHDDPGTLALRRALFQTWRRCPAECRRTMRLLSADETDVMHFHRAFLRVLIMAAQQVLQDSLFLGRWGHTARALGGFVHWLRWLATGNAEDSSLLSPELQETSTQ
jgi:2-polyprenyl-6-methoxyphenol hydroxylase-like FAD-dependent oxidoreductase